ncbi:hypothetical protein BKA93DRAFT_823212 [Sparassis latifolia]|uniref:Hydrophobin n=1 Tax=Sparassis crispa TaxID=139825 RepID=A0A401H216_9APHY|nr:Hydrophobin-1 [Sparassis crispa]GBE88400.1 Hydrophobin-1 [Sparassis crispa]
MFSRVAAISFLALPLLAATNPVELAVRQSACSVGSFECCDNTVDPNSSKGEQILGLLGLLGITDLIGMDCSPIASGDTCNASPVCCTDNSSYNFISLGCIPISL